MQQGKSAEYEDDVTRMIGKLIRRLDGLLLVDTLKPQRGPAVSSVLYEKGADPRQFQLLVHAHIQQMPVELQLEELNNIQRDCPFMLCDPFLRPIDSGVREKFIYGHADLFRFLGFPFTSGMFAVATIRFINRSNTRSPMSRRICIRKRPR